MMNFGYNNRWLRLVKDILFTGVAIWIMIRFGLLGAILGALAAYWYGRDAYFQIKALWQEKHYRPQEQPQKGGPSASQPADDGKIQITDLSGTKEVDFEKE